MCVFFFRSGNDLCHYKCFHFFWGVMDFDNLVVFWWIGSTMLLLVTNHAKKNPYTWMLDAYLPYKQPSCKGPSFLRLVFQGPKKRALAKKIENWWQPDYIYIYLYTYTWTFGFWFVLAGVQCLRFYTPNPYMCHRNTQLRCKECGVYIIIISSKANYLVYIQLILVIYINIIFVNYCYNTYSVQD